jgi:hypothetical protein
LVRNSLEVRVQYASFGVQGLSVSISARRWVEFLCQLELGFG